MRNNLFGDVTLDWLGEEDTKADAAPKIQHVEELEDGTIAGRYDAETRTISLARTIRLGDGPREVYHPDRLRTHEEGHATDHALGWPSQDGEFRALVEAARNAEFTPLEKLGVAYYLADPGEAFAEACAFLRRTDGALHFGFLTDERAEALLRGVLDWVRQKVS
jgi:hypothetical protein